MDTVLITGANGFVGRRLVQTFCESGAVYVIAADMQESSACSAVSENFRYCQTDLRDRESVGELSGLKPDCIIHLAGLLPRADDAESHRGLLDANIKGTLHVLEAARECLSKVVFASTGLVYGDQPGPFTEELTPAPEDFYGASKLAAEQFIALFARRYGIISVVFRVAVLYGPGQGGSMFIPAITKALLSGEKFAMTAGEQTRDFIYVDDFITALLIAAETNIQGTFNIGTGVPVMMKDAARVVEKVLGAEGLVDIGAIPYRDKESWQYSLSPEKFTRLTGWSPRVSLEEGLRRVADAQK